MDEVKLDRCGVGGGEGGGGEKEYQLEKKTLTLPTKAGRLVELVAKPMPKTTAAGLPTKRATKLSSSLW